MIACLLGDEYEGIATGGQFCGVTIMRAGAYFVEFIVADCNYCI
jgi:hypothetical protein